MSHAKIVEYLSGFVNRTEEINKLLALFVDATQSEAALLFVRDSNSDHYMCMAASDDISAEFTMSPPPVSVTIGTGVGLDTAYPIKNSMCIPIRDREEQLGLLFMLNREKGYDEDLLSDLWNL